MTFNDLKPLAHDNTRNGVIDGFIAAMQEQIKALRKTATSQDLARIDGLSFAIRELDLVKGMSKVDVGIRLQELASVLSLPEYDEDDRGLAKAGIGIINHVGKYIRDNKITA